LKGGFQVIADLNEYYSFIASLKVHLHLLSVARCLILCEQVANVTADFSHLKMLGHVFVVEEAKDLAQIVRDVTRYGGAYRPEVLFLIALLERL
jgi:recyclin-1